MGGAGDAAAAAAAAGAVPGWEGPRTRQRAAALVAAGRSILDGGSFAFGSRVPALSASLAAAPGTAARPASAGRPAPTVPKSPLLRTKARHPAPPPRAEPPRTVFTARPAPSFNALGGGAGAGAVPFVAPKEPTRPEPFRLATDGRHRRHEAQAVARLEAEREAVGASWREGAPACVRARCASMITPTLIDLLPSLATKL